MTPETVFHVAELLRHVVLFSLLVACAYTDADYGKLFDKITLPAIAIGLILQTLGGGLGMGGEASLSLKMFFTPRTDPMLVGAIVGAVFGYGVFWIKKPQVRLSFANATCAPHPNAPTTR